METSLRKKSGARSQKTGGRRQRAGVRIPKSEKEEECILPAEFINLIAAPIFRLLTTD